MALNILEVNIKSTNLNVYIPLRHSRLLERIVRDIAAHSRPISCELTFDENLQGKQATYIQN